MSSIEDFEIVDGVLMKYLGNDGDVHIPNSVKCIKSGFYDNETITSVFIPESVTKIEPFAFKGCKSIKEITIENKECDIGFAAFWGCSNLKCIKLHYTALNGSMFKTSSKMVKLQLMDYNDVQVFGIFRKEYYSQTFIYSKDFITPITDAERNTYDRVLAVGKWDGFDTNENGRIEAVLNRICDCERPISYELQPQFSEFIKERLKKVIQVAAQNDFMTILKALIGIDAISINDWDLLNKTVSKIKDFNLELNRDEFVGLFETDSLNSIKNNTNFKKIEVSCLPYDFYANCQEEMIEITSGINADWVANAVISDEVQKVIIPASLLYIDTKIYKISDDLKNILNATGKVKKEYALDTLKTVLKETNANPCDVAYCYQYAIHSTDFIQLFKEYLPSLSDSLEESVNGIKQLSFNSETMSLLQSLRHALMPYNCNLSNDGIPRFAGTEETIDINTLIYLLLCIEDTINCKAERLLKLLERKDLSEFLIKEYMIPMEMFALDIIPLIRIITRLCTPDAVSKVYSECKTIQKNAYSTTTIRYKNAESFFECLNYCNNSDVILMLDKRKYSLYSIAATRKCSVEELRASLISSSEADFDSNGEFKLDYGSRLIKVTLNQDMTFSFVDLETNKSYKTLPKGNNKDDASKVAKAGEIFKTVKDNVKNISKILTNKINHMLYTGTSVSVTNWERDFLKSKISKILSTGIMWGLYDEDDNLKNAFIVDINGNATDINGNSLDIYNRNLIGVVDAVQLSDIELTEWRNYFWGHGIKAVINQFESPARYVPLDFISSRYKDCSISVGYAMSALNFNPWRDTIATLSCSCFDIHVVTSNRGQTDGEMTVESIFLTNNTAFANMNSHQKRLFNRDILHMDAVLHPERRITNIVTEAEVEVVKSLVDTKVITPDNITNLIGASSKAKNTPVSAYLLDLKKEWLGDLQDPFADFIL